jgi:hypothetical protein
VTVTALPLWRLKLVREAPRYLLCAASVAGLAASARFAIFPPAAPRPAQSPAQADQTDLASQGYAVLFARRYLTWSAEQAEASARGLSGMTGALEPAAGFVAPQDSEQHVEWAEVVQSRMPAAGVRIYTVAAQTDTAGLLYLSVGVVRDGGGDLALAGYPALVGAPASAPAPQSPHLRDVTDAALATVVSRALRNYLADARGELAADLSSSAVVSLPSLSLTVTNVSSLRWEPDRRSVQAVVQARDRRGAQYVLAYELDVAMQQGRWEVSAVQTDPTA